MSDHEIPFARIAAIKNTFELKSDTSTNEHDFLSFNFSMCARVGNALNMTLKPPHISEIYRGQLGDLNAYMDALSRTNHIRVRKVTLKRAWWLVDSGPIIGIYNQKACALLPTQTGYKIVMDISGKSFSVTKNLAKEIAINAYTLLPPIKEKFSSVFSIISFSFSALKKELWRFFTIQILLSLLLLAIPILSGTLFDTIIPTANHKALRQYTILLALIGIIFALFSYVNAKTLLRIRIKAQYKLQTAMWDKILKLPLGFFKQFASGDLNYRCNTITDIQEMLGQNTITSMVEGILSLTNLILMFCIDGYLALAGLFIVMVFVGISIFWDTLSLHYQRQVVLHENQISSLLLSILNAIAKIRMAHKEEHAFERWSDVFSQKMKARMRLSRYRIKLYVMDITYMGLSALLIYTVVLWRGDNLSFWSFIVFNAAFLQFSAAIMGLANTVNQVLEVIPLFDMAKPIFKAKVEDTQDKHPIHQLTGQITVKNLVFRHRESDDPLFVDLNLTITPGAFVAFVGPSGAGKSTLFRLLLGFETAESGEIAYDGVHLQHIQGQSLREKMGVVMQSTQLIPGTLFDNIRGKNTALTRDEALMIADNMGLSDFIDDLPMGLDTIITDGIQSFSGGEIQRINLARAMSDNPQILLLDEATSALDNAAQFKIHDYLNNMTITRLVIAHRFSTIVHADVIHVIHGGQIAESGTYSELMAKKGFFYQLASYQ